MRSFWKLILSFLSLLIVLGAVLLFNTLRLPALSEPKSFEKKSPENLTAAANRLSLAIQIPTISDTKVDAYNAGAFSKFHDFLAQSFPLAHGKLKREIINGSSLLYTWEGSDPSLAPILLTAHMDVVPIESGTEDKWTHPPFSGEIADGFVWGRGSLDMKHVVMATMESIEYLLSSGYQPKRTILIAFGHDEEMGGQQGASKIVELLKQRKVHAQFSLDEGSVILDGFFPGVRRPIAQIGLSEKGYLSLKLTAHASGGHSSMPPQFTAVGKIAQAVNSLELHPMNATLDGPGGQGITELAPALPFPLRLAVANQWLLSATIIHQLSQSPSTNALLRTTTAPTMISGGVKENVLPSNATAVINFRLAPGDTIAKVKQHIAQVIGDPEIEMSEYLNAASEASPVADRNGVGYKMIAQAMDAIDPAAIVIPGLVVAGTDSKHYSEVSDAAYRFAPVRMSPLDVQRIHGTNERISIENYGELILFYGALIRLSCS